MPTFGLNVSGTGGKRKLRINVRETIKFIALLTYISVDLLLYSSLDNGTAFYY